MRFVLLAAGCLLLGCGGGPAPEPAEKAGAEEPRPAPPDERRRFPSEGRTDMQLVNDDALGKDFLPGGNVATYEKDGETYQMFLLPTESPEAAGFLAMDVRDRLADTKFVASFGGWYGLDGETPWFVFAKDKYLLGIVGLEQEAADLAARDFAARVN